MAILYRHTRPDKDEVFYVGIGKPGRELDFKWGRNKHWKGIYNLNNQTIKVDILFEDLTWEEACIKEKEFIKLYGRSDLGLGTLCNMTDGGDGCLGVKQSKETIAKRVAKQLGRPLSEEHKKNLSKSKLGENNPMFGKKFSAEHRAKHRKALLGRKVSKETIRKIAISNGKKIINTDTKEIFNTISEAAAGISMKPKTLNAKLSGQNPNNTSLTYYIA